MIVTVTLNPALQVHYEADHVTLGAVNQVGRVRYQASGRGLGVARLLRTFGHEVIAAGLAGGAAGELIRAELARDGVASQFTRIAAESRRVILVTDRAAGLVTRFEEPAPYITTEELGRFAADYRALLDGAIAVVLSGSLPAGLPPETYGSLTSYAAHAGVPVVLDAGGSALAHGASRGPALVIPELAADEMPPQRRGQGSVVLPASHGVRVLTAAGEWLASVQPVLSGSAPNGSGAASPAEFRDALVAGFVPGIALAWSWPDMLRHAVALAASVTASGEADLGAYEKLLPGATVAGPRT